jgi:PAS domain S-box-containing protein
LRSIGHQRATGELAVAYVDVVGLKSVNETQGHAAGDALLENAVQAMRAHLRSYDVVIRVGGDEFVCVMSGASGEDARQRFAQIQADAAAAGLGLRYGIATLQLGDSASDVIERADSELLAIPPPALGGRVRARPGPCSRPDGSAASAHILVTDDHPEVVALVDNALADRYVCRFAAGLDDAAEALAAASFDLLLCDLRSGDASTMAFARQAVAEYPDTAVILLAPEDDPTVAEKAFEFGAFGYVVRPLPGQLLITSMNALRRRDLESAHRRLSQNREDRRQAIIDMVPIAVFAKDTAGRYVVANAKADALAGMEPGGLLGQSDEAFLTAAQAESYNSGDARILEGVAIVEREDTIEQDGHPRTFKTTRFPLFDEGGTIVAVGGVATDVTVEREAIRLRDRSIEELRLSRQETVERLARAIDRHDSATGRHVNRLSALTSLLGTKLGLDPEWVDLLGHAAPMHDVGKIGTPDEILCKPGPLTAAERAAIELHASNGYEILADSKSELLRLAATIALTHHERYDGSGYPNGLAGEEIPLEGRITAVADVFDALLSDRVYRPAFSVPDAVALLEEGRGSQFDPEVLAALLDNLDAALELTGPNGPEAPQA